MLRLAFLECPGLEIGGLLKQLPLQFLPPTSTLVESGVPGMFQVQSAKHVVSSRITAPLPHPLGAPPQDLGLYLSTGPPDLYIKQERQRVQTGISGCHIWHVTVSDLSVCHAEESKHPIVDITTEQGILHFNQGITLLNASQHPIIPRTLVISSHNAVMELFFSFNIAFKRKSNCMVKKSRTQNQYIFSLVNRMEWVKGQED